VQQFITKHRATITGAISCFDRMLFKGHLPLGWPGAMEGFLARQGLRIKDFGPFVNRHSERIKQHARATAELDLVDEHTARFKDESLSAEQLAKMLRPPPDDARPARLYIHPAANVPDEAAKAFVERVIKSGFEGVIETKRRP
jgi:hypothetical protein